MFALRKALHENDTFFWHYMNWQRGKVKEITKTLHNILKELCRQF